jgi:hypothetical protein
LWISGFIKRELGSGYDHHSIAVICLHQSQGLPTEKAQLSQAWKLHL